MCALAKDPERRYTSARELAEDLDRVLQGDPVQAPGGTKEDIGTRFERWGLAFGGAIGRASGDFARSADAAIHSDKAQSAVERSKKGVKSAADQVKRATESAKAR